MLARLVLLAAQLAVAWFVAPEIVRYLPRLGNFQIFLYAAVFAVLVWIVGLVLSQVLRETGMPSSSTLVASLVMALILAAVILWLPAIIPDIGRMLRQVPSLAYPLIGAVLGYHIKR